MDISKIIEILKKSGIVVIRTDTIYGIIARANDKKAVEKIYATKRRDLSKQCIVLIADASDVPTYSEMIQHISDGEQLPTSVIVPASSEPVWITRGGDSVAYRVVHQELLRNIIKAVGPVIAPSANPEGKPPARTIAEATTYFGDMVDLYVDGGEVPSDIHASQIIKVLHDGRIEHIR